MTNDPARDAERDAWLAQALRHAPDAQAAPPAALSDAILRQARAATAAARPPQAPPARRRWRAVWDALARPSVTAGFASVMVATVVGVMWWGQPMDSTIARPPAADATPAANPPQPEAPPAAPTPDPSARSVAPPPSPAPPGGEASAGQAAPKPAPSRDALAAARSAGTAAAPAPAPAPPRDSPAPLTDPRPVQDAAAPTPPPAAAPPAPMALRAREPDSTGAAAEAKAEVAREDAPGTSGRSALASNAAPRAAAPAARPLGKLADARPATLNALLAAIAAQPERWAWERGGLLQPITPALRRWLAQLDAATAAARPTVDGASVGEAAVLRLYRDGMLTATLRLDDESAGLVSGPRTALPLPALTALKQALDDATR